MDPDRSITMTWCVGVFTGLGGLPSKIVPFDTKELDGLASEVAESELGLIRSGHRVRFLFPEVLTPERPVARELI